MALTEMAQIRPHVTFTAPDQGEFGGPENVRSNHIIELQGAQPDFLVAFKARLKQKRWITSDMVVLFIHSFAKYPLMIKK
jgi:hypothetical protein